MLAMVLNYISLMILAVIGFFGDERTAQFVQGQFQYSNWDVPWMTMDRCVDSCAEHIVIPGGITHNGRYYPVVEIGHDAFRGMRNLVDVTIEMDEMGDKTETRTIGIGFHRGAFKDCPSLSVIQVNDTIPPGIGKHPFYGGELTEVFEPYHLEGTIIVVPPGLEEKRDTAMPRAGGNSSISSPHGPHLMNTTLTLWISASMNWRVSSNAPKARLNDCNTNLTACANPVKRKKGLGISGLVNNAVNHCFIAAAMLLDGKFYLGHFLDIKLPSDALQVFVGFITASQTQ